MFAPRGDDAISPEWSSIKDFKPRYFFLEKRLLYAYIEN